MQALGTDATPGLTIVVTEETAARKYSVSIVAAAAAAL